jgi:hypothetical protein
VTLLGGWKDLAYVVKEVNLLGLERFYIDGKGGESDGNWKFSDR